MDQAALQQQQLLRANLLLAQLQQQQQQLQQHSGPQQQVMLPAQQLAALPLQQQQLILAQISAAQQHQAQAHALAQAHAQAQDADHAPTPPPGPGPEPDPLSVLLGAVMSEVEAREEPKPIGPPPEGPHFLFASGEAGPCYVPRRPRTQTLPPDLDPPGPAKGEEAAPEPSGRPVRRPSKDVAHLTAWVEALSGDDLAEHEIAEALFDLARRVEEPPRRRGPVTRGGREPFAREPLVYKDRAERRTPVQYSAMDAGTLDDDDEDYTADAAPVRRGRGPRGGAVAAGAKRARAPARGGRLLEPARKLTKKVLGADPFAGQATVPGAAPGAFYLQGLPGWGEEAGPGPGSLQARVQMPPTRRPALRSSALHAHIAYFIQWHQAAGGKERGAGEGEPGEGAAAAAPPQAAADEQKPAAPDASPSAPMPFANGGPAGFEGDVKAAQAAMLSQQAQAQLWALQQQQQAQMQQMLAARAGALPMVRIFDRACVLLCLLCILFEAICSHSLTSCTSPASPPLSLRTRACNSWRA